MAFEGATAASRGQSGIVIAMRGGCLLLFLIGALAPSPCAAGQPLQHSVLILEQSPGPFFSALSTAAKGELMADTSVPISVYTENLDLGRFGDARVEASTRAYFREKYRDKPIGLILASGALALDFMLRARAELWPQAPTVFAGVDEASAARLELPADATGITMRLSLKDLVSTARALV